GEAESDPDGRPLCRAGRQGLDARPEAGCADDLPHAGQARHDHLAGRARRCPGRAADRGGAFAFRRGAAGIPRDGGRAAQGAVAGPPDDAQPDARRHRHVDGARARPRRRRPCPHAPGRMVDQPAGWWI
ncbi:MAG: hypothetical protein AVDCRST_MAG88-1433, partial [uncultured Thermomicrobiales bacterium]